MKKFILGIIFLFVVVGSFGQTTNDVLNLLVKKKTITQDEADSIRAEAAIKQQDVDGNKKSFFATTGRPLQLTGYSQVRYQFIQQTGKTDGFDIRRARLDLQANVSPYFSYKLLADFAGSPKLLEAYAELKLKDYFNITIGEAKIPFSFQNLLSDSKIEISDRAQVVEALVSRSTDVIGNQNGRDIGVQVGGSFLKSKHRYLLDYKVGLFNGAGINVADNNNNKDLAGRLVAHPIESLSMGGSFYSGTGFYGTPTAANHVRNRTGIELNYEYQRFLLRSEYIEGKDGAIKRNGWYAETGYFLIPSHFQLVLRYDTNDPNSAVSNNATTNYLLGGTYHFNNWSKIQAAFTIIKKEASSKTNNMGVIQYQISF